MVLIKKRNFKPYILNWLLPKLNVGLSIGNIFYVAPASGALEANLLDNGVPSSEIFHSLVTVEDAMRDGYHDVALIANGTYTETTETDWDKSLCHMVGMGPRRQKSNGENGPLFYTASAIGAVLHLTGNQCQFHNVAFKNAGASASALTAFKVAGNGTRLIGCEFVGLAAATQRDTAYASALEIASGGYYFYAEECLIGSTDVGDAGAVDTNAPLVFSGGMISDGRFVACNVSAIISATTRPLVYIIGRTALDRDWIFDRCVFYAFSADHAYKCAEVVKNSDATPSTYDMLFQDCTALNCSNWRTASNYGMTWAAGGVAAGDSGVAVVTVNG